MSAYEIAKRAFDRLHRYVQKNRYKGYEFDDFLASPLVRLLCLNNLLLQRIAIQVGELFPLNMRPLVGIKKLESTKARGFFAKGYLYAYQATGDLEWLKYAEENLQWLMKHHSQGFPGISWGNAFEFGSRGGFTPKGHPTIVWTAHIAEAFDFAYRITKKKEYKKVLKKAGEFILAGLKRHEDDHGICFAYEPGRLNLIYNSNLLGAATLLRCWQYCQEPEYYETARLSYQWTIAHSNPDGSWYYGAESKYSWIDNFHTAYNIDCLVAAYEITGEKIVSFGFIEKVYKFWIGHFFEEDGTPWYYHNRKYPLDIQCASQAIETLSRLAKYFSSSIPLTTKVMQWTVKNMQKTNGAFRYQIRHLWRNNLESIHWGEATMLAALGAYWYNSLCDTEKAV